MKKIFLFIASLCVVASVQAEGYQVNSLSAKQSGMGHTGTAMKLGSESIFFNPAATVFQESKFHISVGATGILSNVEYSPLPSMGNDYTKGAVEKSDNSLSTPIHIYMNYKPTERLAVGLGFYTPYGSSMNWGDDWSGAHLIQSINLAAYTVQPTVSYKLADNLSIGIGATVTWGNFDLSRSLLSPATRQGLIAGVIDPTLASLPTGAPQVAILEGAKEYLNATMNESIVSTTLSGDSDMAVGINAGIFWDVNEKISLGMTYRSRQIMKVAKGTAVMHKDAQAAELLDALGTMMGGASLLPALDQGTFHTELPLPANITWGVSYRPIPKVEFALDVQWVGWSAYEDLNVVFNEEELGIAPIYSVKNYSNTLIWRFGAQYHAADFLTLRAGLYVDESPVDSSYLNPETPSMTKVAYTGGFTLRPSKSIEVDFAYSYITPANPERTGSYPLYSTSTGELSEVFSGNYDLNAHLFSVGVGFKF